MPADEADIIAAVLGGDRDRYAELVQRYQAAAWKLAYSFVGNWDDARDISQAAFIKAYHGLGRFRGRAKFSTWLYRIVVNECKDAFKRRARQPRTVEVAPRDDADAPIFDVEDPGRSPQDRALDRELAGRVHEAVGRLSAQQRAAFTLHHLHGLPLDEVAGVMGCRVGTVKAHLFRACDQLRNALSPYIMETPQ